MGARYSRLGMDILESIVCPHPWKLKLSTTSLSHTKWPFEHDTQCKRFSLGLWWKIALSCVATTEVACSFWWQVKHHSQLEASCPDHVQVIYHDLSYLKNCQVHPSTDIPNKSSGRVMPKGVIDGVHEFICRMGKTSS